MGKWANRQMSKWANEQMSKDASGGGKSFPAINTFAD
jgi:hypothetical protein